MFVITVMIVIYLNLINLIDSQIVWFPLIIIIFPINQHISPYYFYQNTSQSE